MPNPKAPLVSIIVPTRDSAATLQACLQSIKQQTYKPIELIVVDRDSTDDTKKIGRKYTKHVFNHGPERSAQRNFGTRKARGQYIVMVDSDMELDEKVIEACVDKIKSDKKIREVVIPEESFGQGFWAQCKRLERSFYVGVDWIEAARFFDKAALDAVGGYDESMVSGEDWDLSRRIAEQARPPGAEAGQGSTANIDEFIRHNEGKINLWKTLKKKYYYAQHAKAYLAKNPDASAINSQKGPIQRYNLFFSHPAKLLKNPIVGVSMLFMKTCEFGAGGFGFFSPQKITANQEAVKNKNVFIVCHTNGRNTGNLGVLQEFLMDKGFKTSQLLHPLDFGSTLPTTYSSSGELVKYRRRSRNISSLVWDLQLSIKIIRKANIDIYVGCTNFDTIPAIFCRKILRKNIPIILYYPRDYSENRYKNKILNYIYYYFEKLAVKNSEYTISYTKRAESMRIKHGLLVNKSLVIPNIVSLPDPVFSRKKIQKDLFIYSGDVSIEHGLYDLINVLKDDIKKLVIIGSGPDWDRTIKLAKKLDFKLELHYKKNRDYVIKYLKNFNGIGLAPYNHKEKWTYYASPLKVTEFISCGVPVLISDVPEVANEIKHKRLGVVYHSLDKNHIIEKLNNFEPSHFEIKARQFYKEHRVDKLLEKVPFFIDKHNLHA